MLKSEMIKDIIDDWLIAKKREDILTGKEYYSGKNEILNKDYNEYDIDGQKFIDKNKSNVRINNSHFIYGVEQKAGYMLSDPVTITSELVNSEGEVDDPFLDEFNRLMGKKFDTKLIELIVEASVSGVGYIHPYVKKGSGFEFKIYESEYVIPIKDTEHQEDIIEYLHFYPMEVYDEVGEKRIRNRVEHWNDTEVAVYQELEEKGTYQLIPEEELGMANPQPHWFSWTSFEIDESSKKVTPHVWGRPPIIELPNNLKSDSDLNPIKNYIDCIDLISSGYINNLEDVQLMIWVLKGYEGQDLREFMTNLLKYKAMAVSEDGGVEAKSMDIPFEASTKLLDWCEGKIYLLGGIANIDDMKSGNVTNVMIKAIYNGLHNKSKTLLRYLNLALDELAEFAAIYLKETTGKEYDPSNLKYTFNLGTIMNEKEYTEQVMATQGTLSRETMIRLLPFDIDVEKELERLEKEMTPSFTEDDFGGE